MGEVIRTPAVHRQEPAPESTSLNAGNIASGSLNVDIGNAPLYPAEFVAVQIGQLNEASTPPPPQNPVKPLPL